MVFDGQDVTALGPAARTRLGIGRSFQLTHVFPSLTVVENVRLAVQARAGCGLVAWRDAGAYPELEDEARAILGTVRLDAGAGAPAGTLPHGDKRKPDAGVLLGLDPRLLLLDEPTAGMALEEVLAIVPADRGDPARGDADHPARRAQDRHGDGASASIPSSRTAAHRRRHAGAREP